MYNMYIYIYITYICPSTWDDHLIWLEKESQVYCDLDGVLADFNKGCLELFPEGGPIAEKIPTHLVPGWSGWNRLLEIQVQQISTGGVGSKPMTINFSGMNIYLPAMTWGSLGTRVLTHPQVKQVRQHGNQFLTSLIEDGSGMIIIPRSKLPGWYR